MEGEGVPASQDGGAMKRAFIYDVSWGPRYVAIFVRKGEHVFRKLRKFRVFDFGGCIPETTRYWPRNERRFGPPVSPFRRRWRGGRLIIPPRVHLTGGRSAMFPPTEPPIQPGTLGVTGRRHSLPSQHDATRNTQLPTPIPFHPPGFAVSHDPPPSRRYRYWLVPCPARATGL